MHPDSASEPEPGVISELVWVRDALFRKIPPAVTDNDGGREVLQQPSRPAAICKVCKVCEAQLSLRQRGERRALAGLAPRIRRRRRRSITDLVGATANAPP